MKKLNPVIRGIISAIVVFAIIMAIDYIKSMIGNKRQAFRQLRSMGKQ